MEVKEEDNPSIKIWSWALIPMKKLGFQRMAMARDKTKGNTVGKIGLVSELLRQMQEREKTRMLEVFLYSDATTKTANLWRKGSPLSLSLSLSNPLTVFCSQNFRRKEVRMLTKQREGGWREDTSSDGAIGTTGCRNWRLVCKLLAATRITCLFMCLYWFLFLKILSGLDFIYLLAFWIAITHINAF